MLGFDFVVAIGLLMEGIISFLSPCILPLVPLYIGYLTSNAAGDKSNGKSNRLKVMMMTNVFVLGICTVFFIMGLGVNTFRTFFIEYQDIIALAGSSILILFGLMNLGLFKKLNLARTFKFEPKFAKNGSYFSAYLLGFFFSFAWTPCVGPFLANALIEASTANFLVGNLYILAYGLGFVVPFLVIGVFTEQALNLIKKNMNILQATVKVGGIVIILMGTYMGYDALVNINAKNDSEVESYDGTAVDFELNDQFGVTHTLADYQGDAFILQFYASWCGYCRANLPTITEFAKDAGVDVLLVATPGLGDEMEELEFIVYLNEQGVTLPVLMDQFAELYTYYGIQGLPTTVMIDKRGDVMGVQSGVLPVEYLAQWLRDARLSN